MKKFLGTLLLGTFVSATASASLITYENRATDNGVDRSDYQSSWNNQSSYIHSRDLDGFTGLRAQGSNRHQHSHLSISFDVGADKSGMDWWFQFSPDAGYGGEVYFNGNLVDRDSSNLWWGYRWSRTSELLDALINDLDTGTHTIDMYWAENCCNGRQAGRFSVDNGASWMALTTENLDAVGVSEPGSLALLALGAAGLVMTRKRQK